MPLDRSDFGRESAQVQTRHHSGKDAHWVVGRQKLIERLRDQLTLLSFGVQETSCHHQMIGSRWPLVRDFQSDSQISLIFDRVRSRSKSPGIFSWRV